MTIHLTPEQARRLQAVMNRGAYHSVEEAALSAMEQRTVPGFVGTPQQLGEDTFWTSVNQETDALLDRESRA